MSLLTLDVTKLLLALEFEIELQNRWYRIKWVGQFHLFCNLLRSFFYD